MNKDISYLTPEGYDLTETQGVHDYLSKTPFASTEAVPLSGGNANYVYRLYLKNPYEGRDSLVMKHGRPYLKTDLTLALATERQNYEVEALNRVGAWVSPNSIVTVPKVHLFDESSHVIIMDDSGVDSINLKSFMQQGRVTLPIAEQIGSAIGEFIGGMHKWGRGNAEVLDVVRSNEQAKTISAWYYYGRLVSTLKGLEEDGLPIPKLSSPPLEIKGSDMEVVEKVVEETTKAMLDAQDSFVMGDFWPGNIMVSLNKKGDLERLYILDWEITRVGIPGIEVGQFCAEIHMLRRFNPEVCGDTATLVLEHFLKAYAGDAEQARRAFVHMGVHMSVLGARIEWGEKEVTRQVVLEGVRKIVDGYSSKAVDFSRLAQE